MAQLGRDLRAHLPKPLCHGQRISLNYIQLLRASSNTYLPGTSQSISHITQQQCFSLSALILIASVHLLVSLTR